MSRPVILSNGSMLVGINRFGLVHDFYYPYVGQENHTTAQMLRHLIGVWVDGSFSWLDGGQWTFTFSYDDNALISHTIATNLTQQITISLHDAVDSEETVFMRHITVTNNAKTEREVRLMIHQGYRISNSLSGGTVRFMPHEEAILHYKGRRHFLIKTRDDSGESFDQYSVGIYGIEGKEGTFRDAEDGELAGNAVEHGKVDSVVRHSFIMPSGSSRSVEYWVSAGTSFKAALATSRLIGQKPLTARYDTTAKSWRDWLKKSRVDQFKDRKDRVAQSLLLIKAHIDDRGAVIASSDTQMLNYARDAYAYCWPRDAMMALWPLIRAGHTKEARRFFSFCHEVMEGDGYLMHKYQPDGALGSSWHPYLHDKHPILPIQEDETAGVVYLIGQFADVSSDKAYVAGLYEKLVKPMAHFLNSYIEPSTGLPKASYDLWEEKFQTSTYTVGLVYGALMEAARLAEKHGDWDAAITWHATASEIKVKAQELLFNHTRGYFCKGLEVVEGKIVYDPTIDISSVYGAYAFGMIDVNDDQISQSIKTIEEMFSIGKEFKGLPRYEHDIYNSSDKNSLGNPWFVTSLWLAQYYIETSRNAEAERIIAWTESHMMGTGVLSEQVTPQGESISVAPLVWSQAEYVATILDLQASRRRPRSSR